MPTVFPEDVRIHESKCLTGRRMLLYRAGPAREWNSSRQASAGKGGNVRGARNVEQARNRRRVAPISGHGMRKGL